MPFYGWGEFPQYQSVAARRREAERQIQRLRKKGEDLSPVCLDGAMKIAKTFWGKAWCDNIESYRDLANRLERGRSYVRHNQVIDLKIHPGRVEAKVSGTSIYHVQIRILPLPAQRWTPLVAHCTGQIASMVALLQGRFSKEVMAVFCDQERGLFPAPREIQFSCSCPDSAALCKHIAAALYGIGSRLDTAPELLFRLRDVDESALLISAGALDQLSATSPDPLDDDDLSAIFGIEIGAQTPPPPPPPAPPPQMPPPPKGQPLLLGDELLLVLIAALFGEESWDDLPAFRQKHHAWLSALLPSWSGGPPEPSMVRALAPALRPDMLLAWQRCFSGMDRRLKPTNRLLRGMAAAAAILPGAGARLQGDTLLLEDVSAAVRWLSLFEATEEMPILLGGGQATPAQLSAISAAGGRYVLPVEGALAEEVALFFRDAKELDFDGIPHGVAGKGRQRVVWVDWVDWLPEAAQWPGLSGVFLVERGPQRWYGLSNGGFRLAKRLVGCPPPAGGQITLSLSLPTPSATLGPFRALADTLLRHAGKRTKGQVTAWRAQAPGDPKVLLEVLGRP